MRDLRIIVVESRTLGTWQPALEAGAISEEGFERAVREDLTAQSDETRRRKGLAKRASLLAGYLGGATDPKIVAACRRWIEVCDRLGWTVEVDSDVAAQLLGVAK